MLEDLTVTTRLLWACTAGLACTVASNAPRRLLSRTGRGTDAHTRGRPTTPRHRDDAGYTTEAVIVTALLAAAAIAIIAIIVAKVTDRARSISL